MKYLTKEQVIQMHEELIESTGGKNGIIDNALLDSALNVPFATFDGVEEWIRGHLQ